LCRLTLVFSEMPGDYSWAFDLIAPDDEVRHRAVRRQRASVAAAVAALRWSNRVWAEAGTCVPSEPHLAAQMDQATADFRWHRYQSLEGPVETFCLSGPRDPAAELLYAPYAVLSLRWEALYPRDWGARESWLWSPWTGKEVLLRRLDRGGIPDAVRSQVADLVLAAVRRPYRCKDWMYAPLVRHLRDDAFVSRLDALLDADDPLVRLRAQFVRQVAAHPQRRVKRVSWQRWLANDG
jgi:hypothetical protein